MDFLPIEKFILRICGEHLLDRGLLEFSIDELAAQWAHMNYKDFSSDELLQCVNELLARGVIREFDELESRGINDRYAFVGLSSAGQAIWESTFNPKWGTFSRVLLREICDNTKLVEIDCEAGSPEACSARIGSTLIQGRFSHSYGLRNFKFAIIENWDATYWKRLGKGFRFSCLAQYRDPNEVMAQLSMPHEFRMATTPRWID